MPSITIYLDEELFFLRKEEKLSSYAPKGWASGKKPKSQETGQV